MVSALGGEHRFQTWKCADADHFSPPDRLPDALRRTVPDFTNGTSSRQRPRRTQRGDEGDRVRHVELQGIFATRDSVPAERRFPRLPSVPRMRPADSALQGRPEGARSALNRFGKTTAIARVRVRRCRATWDSKCMWSG
jgi:hypothetical protein